MTKTTEVDITVQNEGSIFILWAETTSGNAWMDDHIPDATLWGSGGRIVEHRYVGDILDGIMDDGLIVGGSFNQ